MKLRSKEINIFSMSALDLFASAMGAFMLLSVMSLPFFPNLPPVVVVPPIEPPPTPTPTPPQEDPVLISDLDIVICLDVTGSMDTEIDQLKLQIADLVRVLDRLAPSVGIGLVAFGDRLYDQPLTILEITPTTDLTAITNFVDLLEPNLGMGGGDNPTQPEALGMALDRAVGMNWRSESLSRHIVVITDAPGYPEEINSTLQAARDFTAVTSTSQFVSAVMVGDDDARGFLEQLAEAGGSEFIDSTSGQSMLASIIMAVVNI